MPEKRVILCEGIHDVYFFSMLLNEREIKHRTITKEALSLTRERTPEANVIRDFISPTKGKGLRYLIKDEGGCVKCIDNFTVLYEEKDDRYVMFLCLDSDAQNLQRLRQQTLKRFEKDILNPQSENFHLTKSHPKHSVFFIPESLEDQVRAITGKNLDRSDRDDVKRALKEFIQKCREEKTDWFMELEEVLFQSSHAA